MNFSVLSHVFLTNLSFLQVFNQMVFIFHSFKDLEDFWDDLPVSRLKYNALDDFQEVFQTTSISVVWTSWKSSALPGSRLDFLEVVWQSLLPYQVESKLVFVEELSIIILFVLCFVNCMSTLLVVIFL
ncbi:unnamed protein product [Brassica rapa]|uniref:Uncharacterized protein n=1 Tax=Brassica campestris TaxID=3711 RepID=A0A8D9LT50_BRACM|nr:unnamed protein product [Brassica rapa]